MRRGSARRICGATALLMVAGHFLGVGRTEPGRAASTRPGRVSYYLALGDSVPMWNGTRSYPYLIRAHYQRKLPGLRLDDIAVSGETTTSMRDFQYPKALRFLRTHKRRVALITIDIGGNDIVGCSVPAGLDPTGPCVMKARATIKRNLSVMLAGLHKAAPGVPVIGMNYYDPFLAQYLTGTSGQNVAFASVSLAKQVNGDLASAYRAKHFKVADAATAFDTYVPFSTTTTVRGLAATTAATRAS